MIYYSLVIILILIIGFISIILDIKKLINNINFSSEYSNNFFIFLNTIVNDKHFDDDKYNWLVANADKEQRILGLYGIVDVEKFNQIYNNRPMFLDFLQDIAELSYSKFEVGFSKDIVNEINWIRIAFLRYNGNNKEEYEDLIKKAINPIFWLQYGVKFIINMPMTILSWFGFISSSSLNNIRKGKIISFISSVISTITFLATIMTIVLGWDDFLKFIFSFIK